MTLIHTDVEGSTELWEWDKDTMDVAQSLHDRLLRSQLSKFYGYEVRIHVQGVLACTYVWGRGGGGAI